MDAGKRKFLLKVGVKMAECIKRETLLDKLNGIRTEYQRGFDFEAEEVMDRVIEMIKKEPAAAECSDTFQAHLQQLCDIKGKQIDVLQALCEDMENTAKEYRAFKEYFEELYGCDLTVGNWHLNGALEPFDNFYEKAVDEMKKERHNEDRI